MPKRKSGKIKNNLMTWFGTLPGKLLNDEQNRRIVCIGVYGVLCIVSLVMTVLNIFTYSLTDALTLCTGGFSILCLINIGVAYSGQKGVRVASVLFSVEILLMFSFFLISGKPDGFSVIWICMLPSLGMLAFGMLHSSILSGIMLAELITLLWFDLPFVEIYPYNDTFRMRYPILFAAFWILAIVLEILRLSTYREMKKLERRIAVLSFRDPLTGLFNRRGMYQAVENHENTTSSRQIGVLMLDIDHFKIFNDRYGHAAGDAVLCEFAALLRDYLKHSVVCRWGGEEFVVIWFDDAVNLDDIERFRVLVSAHDFHHEDTVLHITISIGMYGSVSSSGESIDRRIELADKASYQAKEGGRNRTVVWRE